MIQPVTIIDADNIDDAAKRAFIHNYLVEKTNRNIYNDQEKFQELDDFFEANKHLYVTRSQREDKMFHMILYTLLTVHFNIEREAVQEAVTEGEILELAWEHVSETDFVKDLLANAKVIRGSIDPDTGEVEIFPEH